MRAKLIDRDRGFKALLARVQSASRAKHVALGILGDKAAERYESTSGLTTVEVGSIHEFGAGNVPERSFLRGTFDEKAKELRKRIRGVADAWMVGRMHQDRGLALVGNWMKGQVVARINRGIPPPNSEATKRRKGSSKPLIHTGQLKGSIDFEVRGTFVG